MATQTNKKDLHIRVDPDLYAKVRHITFYDRLTLTEVVNRLLAEYVEERAIEEQEIISPPLL